MDSGVDTGGELLLQNEAALLSLETLRETCAEVGIDNPDTVYSSLDIASVLVR